MPGKNEEPRANHHPPNDALATLSAELDGCRKAIDYCLDLAIGPELLPENFPRAPGNEARDLRDRFNLMQMAIELMEASAGLGEAIARIKGEMRQFITVDRYEHGRAGGSPAQNLSTQRSRERGHPANVIHAQGEGEVRKSEKRPGE